MLLKPCPFCCAPARIDSNRSYRNIQTGQLERSMVVYCTECSAEISVCLVDVPDIDVDQLVAMWNQRISEKSTITSHSKCQQF
jgi:hypothetical protein